MAKLKIKILGDNSSLKRAISGSKARLSTFAKGAGALFAGMALGVAVVVASLKKLKTILDPVAARLDKVAKASRRVGVSAKEMQYLQFAAERTGSSVDMVERAFKRMQKTIFDAGKGLSTARDALSALGLSYKDLENKGPSEQFRILASRIAMVKDESLRSGIAQDVFGRVGLAITPLIQDFEKLRIELESINGVVDDETVKDAEKYADAWTDAKTAFMAFIGETGALQGFANLLNAITAIIVNMSGFFENIGRDFRISGTAQDERSTSEKMIEAIVPGARFAGAIGRAARRTRQQKSAAVAIKQEAIKKDDPAIVKTVNDSVSKFISDKVNKGKMAASGGSSLSGGGVFGSFGGDISGGGFSARDTFGQQQLEVMKRMEQAQKDLPRQIAEAFNMSRTQYIDMIQSIIK